MIDILRVPHAVLLETAEGEHRLSGAREIACGDARILIRDGVVTARARETRFVSITLIWNGAMPDGALALGDAWERGYGDLRFRPLDAARVYPWYFFACAGETTALYGVKTGPDALCCFTVTPHEVRLKLDLRSGGAPLTPSGRTLCCAELVFAEKSGCSPFAAARALTPLMARGAVFPPEPVYGYNNWYYAYGQGSAEETLASARELSELTKGLKNRPFIVIDDCWQKHRPAGFIGGEWTPNERFGDMAALCDKIARLDVKPGLWFRPLQTRDPRATADMRLNTGDSILDPTHPDSLALIAEDVKRFIGWGFRLLKHDYSTYDATGGVWGKDAGEALCKPEVRFRDGTKTTAEAIKTLYTTIHDAAGGEALILGCNTIGHLGVGCMELDRTGDDTSGKDWARTKKMGVNTLAFRMPQHGAFYAADADCVGITPDVPWEKNGQWLRLLSESGTPLFISAAPGSLTGPQYAEIRRAFEAAAARQPVGEPLDWMENAYPESWRLRGLEVRFFW